MKVQQVVGEMYEEQHQHCYMHQQPLPRRQMGYRGRWTWNLYLASVHILPERLKNKPARISVLGSKFGIHFPCAQITSVAFVMLIEAVFCFWI